MINSQSSAPISANLVIEQIWHRARINAWAHKTANIQYSKRDTVYFNWIIATSLISILLILTMYVTTTDTMIDDDSNKKILLAIFTGASIFFAVLSLYFAIMSNHLRFAIKAEEHKFLMNSYQHIAQRAREVKWPDKPEDEVIELLKDLERDFALLKARGNEPLNAHYETAHKLFREVKADKDTRIAQSFDLNTVNQTA